jgi:hypothetical protein
MGFKKFQNSAQNPKLLAFGFTENTSLRQNLTETSFFLVVKPTIQISYTYWSYI